MTNPFEIIEKRLIALHDLVFEMARKSGHFVESNNSTSNLLTAEQLRERLDICKASERAYVQAGILKPQHLGRRVYYSWDEVTAAMSSKKDDLLPPKLRGRKKTANQI